MKRNEQLACNPPHPPSAAPSEPPRKNPRHLNVVHNRFSGELLPVQSRHASHFSDPSSPPVAYAEACAHPLRATSFHSEHQVRNSTKPCPWWCSIWLVCQSCRWLPTAATLNSQTVSFYVCCRRCLRNWIDGVVPPVEPECSRLDEWFPSSWSPSKNCKGWPCSYLRLMPR